MVRFRQSRESGVEPGISRRSEASRTSLTIRLARGASVGTPWPRKKIWDQKSPLWLYVAPSISQTNNKLWAPFENKMRERERERERFLQRSVFRFVHWISWIMYETIQHPSYLPIIRSSGHLTLWLVGSRDKYALVMFIYRTSQVICFLFGHIYLSICQSIVGALPISP